MPRPSPRLIALALAALALSALAMVWGTGVAGGGLAIWIVFGGLVFADLALSLRGAAGIEFDAPDEVFVGESFEVSANASLSAPGLSARIDWPDGLVGPAEVALPPSGTGASAIIRLIAIRRGTWPVTQCWMRWPSRLRLLEFTPRKSLDLTISAVPNVRPVQSGTIDVKVRSSLFGVKETYAKGEGAEFHQLRDFVPGMDVRSIDWKRSARHRQLVAKEMRAERNHHLVLALDNGHLMREEIDGLPKIDHAINAALVTAWAALLGGDLVGLYAFDARPRLFVPPEPGRRAFARLRSHTASLTYSAVETNHTLAMATLSARTPRRSMIVVFSDFADTTSAELLVENVAVLSRRHIIVFVALRDPEVEAIATRVPESLDDVAQSVVAAQMQRERTIVMQRLSRMGVRVVDVAPKAVSPRLLSVYLDYKSSEAA